ncbi:Uroporphyrinogen decarboxylase [Thiorhodovibrio winogradskyi]|uniref:Uroporphyrinogen decarboxylase n=1 Tax=Thiorhodovibrio winogradskyi TaxID=77007 RepID=A0ABZ0S791_9GAMM|nr:uroporphyrinogen decarboxylase family protein [Thiorhodovibrio winogradskyi]
MKSLERIVATVAFRATDRTPVIPQVFGHAAVLSGVPLEDYVCDGALLARCQLEALAHYRYDAVFALMDVNVEAEALGLRLNFAADRYPTVQAHALAAELLATEPLRLPDPESAGRMPELLRAAHLLREALGDEVAVVGCVLGPMSLCAQLLGLEAALYLAIDEPEQFMQLLDFATEVLIRFGVAQINAGVHLPLVFDPAASPEIIPVPFYREFLVPRLVRLFSALKAAGARFNWLHTTGAIGAILPFYPLAGVELANLDYAVEPELAMQGLSWIAMNGNLKPLDFVYGAPDDIAKASARLLDLFAPRGGFILSSGCEIPPEARPENIMALVAAAMCES